jgi:hypothetical protein
METLRVVKRRGTSTFIGLDHAINLEYESVNDESTRCHFCPNNCARTFIDTKTPEGDGARYISGFSCEKGTVESEEAMLALLESDPFVAGGVARYTVYAFSPAAGPLRSPAFEQFIAAAAAAVR